MAQTFMFGGFTREGDAQTKIDWLERSIKEVGVGEPESTYFKGDEFKGRLFARLRNAEAANKVLEAINKSKPQFDNNEIWCKPDAPVEVRVVRSVLLGLRWQLGE